MRITVTGATGFLGSRLVERLRLAGHPVRALSRRPAGRPGFFTWDPPGGAPPEAALAGAEAIVHLAGEPVAQRWSPAARARIRASRVEGTRRLVEALSTLSPRPEVLISASAIGYYGARGDEVLVEESAPGAGFLAEVCQEWEHTASLARALGIRVVQPRLGIVLGPGGALERMLPAFSAGLGGPLAGGRQWMSWIHVDDVLSLVECALTDRRLSGPLNAVAPGAVTNAEFTRLLARQLRRPALLPVPAAALRLLFGEMATLLSDSQHVVPGVAGRLGYRFGWPELAAALADLL